MLQKKYEDYLNELYLLYPDIEEESIKSIVEFGLKKLYNYVKDGGDIFLRVKKEFMFIGRSSQGSLNQWNHSKLKEHRKLRRLFLEKKEEWDGFHYFGLTTEENTKFLEEPINISMYKLKKECSIKKGIKYIYRTNLNYKITFNLIPWREERDVSIEQSELIEIKI